MRENIQPRPLTTVADRRSHHSSTAHLVSEGVVASYLHDISARGHPARLRERSGLQPETIAVLRRRDADATMKRAA